MQDLYVFTGESHSRILREHPKSPTGFITLCVREGDGYTAIQHFESLASRPAPRLGPMITGPRRYMNLDGRVLAHRE